MQLEQTWRWFGSNDPIPLHEIRQTGATGIVTALHHIPVGEVWSIEEILKRKAVIEAESLVWSVVESVPVHEDIKKRTGNYLQYIENYKQSIRNLADCGIDIICYNFMPILDWSRTSVQIAHEDGTLNSGFRSVAFAAFDIYILERPNADLDYQPDLVVEAKKYFESMTEEEKQKLTSTILLGLPGSFAAYSIEDFKLAVQDYQGMTDDDLLQNLCEFLKEVAPVAEEKEVYLTIHPDDPPWSLLGLPRVVGNEENITKVLASYQSPANGLAFCTGSLGAGFANDVVNLAQKFADRVNFIHLRNLTRDSGNNFTEAYHMSGDLDLYNVLRTFVLEQKRRVENGRKDIRMPFRPDHGPLMAAEPKRSGINPGYSLLGRMKGLAELRGLEIGIRRSLGV